MQVSFRLREPLSRAHSVDPKDVIRTKAALRALGFYEPDDEGLTPIPDGDLFRGIESFQRKNKLHVDGEIQPNGPTEEKLQERLAKAPAGERRGKISVAANGAGESQRRSTRRGESTDRQDSDGSRREERSPRDEQEAVAPVLPPLAFALAEFLGITAIAAWAWWQSLTKEEQASVLASMGEDGDVEDASVDKKQDGYKEKCLERQGHEQGICHRLPRGKPRFLYEKYFGGCMDRASERKNNCFRQGYPPDEEPDVWSEADMEESRIPKLHEIPKPYRKNYRRK